MKKILGLGNALIDLIFKIENDEWLTRFGLPKGSMTLVDEEKARIILNLTQKLDKEIAAGGSASNTINGLARLGVKCGYIGKIGKDEYGEHFSREMSSNHIDPILLFGENQTGTAIALLSPDAERTFATYLGAAIELNADDLTDELFKGYNYFHIEGYLVQNHELIQKAVQLAKKNGLIVSIDMASFNVVEANIDFLTDIIENYIDIVFANEEEAKAFTGKNPKEALNLIATKCEIAVVKIGKDGSLIKRKNEIIHVEGIKAIPRDTTGAGDLYASGFLYGLTKGYDLELSGKIGSLLGGKVIEVYGARLSEEKWMDIMESIKELTS